MVLKNYTGFARIDPTNPRAQGICDRCGFTYNLRNLKWQFQFVGTQLQNLRYLVCGPCLDVPNLSNKTLILPPDPLPVLNARPEPYAQDENTFITTQESDEIITQDDENIITE